MKLKNLGYFAVIAATAVVLAIGSAVPSEAKGKKKAAPPPPPPAAPCMLDGPQVCGVKGKLKFTYANTCYAAKDGAKVVSSKACPTKKAMKAGKKSKKAAKKK